mmetsp:Transcript_10613/g.27517  ORF Transcript_10613/g.27517 Transcript_10613/m.27517 type:complete len:205 (+) Transcript_10613:388-1002(+)
MDEHTRGTLHVDVVRDAYPRARYQMARGRRGGVAHAMVRHLHVAALLARAAKLSDLARALVYGVYGGLQPQGGAGAAGALGRGHAHGSQPLPQQLLVPHGARHLSHAARIGVHPLHLRVRHARWRQPARWLCNLPRVRLDGGRARAAAAAHAAVRRAHQCGGVGARDVRAAYRGRRCMGAHCGAALQVRGRRGQQGGQGLRRTA